METPIDPELTAEHPGSPEEDAYQKAKAGFELFGTSLHPFSPSRKVAAQTMGMLYPYIGEGGTDQFNKTGSYPGMLKDIIVLCWLCTLPDPSEMSKEEVKSGAFNPSRAMNNAEKALEAAMAWAAEFDLMDMNGVNYTQAAQVFCAIVTGQTASEFRLSLVETAEPGAESGGEGPKV